jgi:predicted component of type VI protein secretion system
VSPSESGAAPRALLHVLSGAELGRSYRVEPGAVVGRHEDCELVLRDASVSRRHARFEFGPLGWSLLDLGSRNGLGPARGGRVERLALSDGDELRVGEVQLRWRLDATGAASSELRFSAARGASAPSPSSASPALPEEIEIESAPATAAELGGPTRFETRARVEPVRASEPAVARTTDDARAQLLRSMRAQHDANWLSSDLAQAAWWIQALALLLACALAAGVLWGAFEAVRALR